MGWIHFLYFQWSLMGCQVELWQWQVWVPGTTDVIWSRSYANWQFPETVMELTLDTFADRKMLWFFHTSKAKISENGSLILFITYTMSNRIWLFENSIILAAPHDSIYTTTSNNEVFDKFIFQVLWSLNQKKEVFWLHSLWTVLRNPIPIKFQVLRLQVRCLFQTSIH